MYACWVVDETGHPRDGIYEYAPVRPDRERPLRDGVYDYEDDRMSPRLYQGGTSDG